MKESDKAEIINRLTVIELMLAEGRRTTQRWGWMFLLWGIGPLLAMFWETHWPRPPLAWPVVLGACVIVNGALAKMRKRRGEGQTTVMRSVGAVWASAGSTVLLVMLASAFSGSWELRSLYAVLFATVGVAHSASSIILRWWPQFCAAVAWWAATAAALMLPAAHLRALSVIALSSNIVFGAWLTYREWSLEDA